MTENRSARQRWEKYRPSKTAWFWSCFACVVLTMAIGFTVGGWVSGGTAQEMAADARDEARTELAATLCVEKFVNGPEFATNLAALKDESSWSRDNFITEGGWVVLAGLDEPVDGSAELCADRLAEMESPSVDAAKEEQAAGNTKG